jgi:hypothetical protein
MELSAFDATDGYRSLLRTCATGQERSVAIGRSMAVR